MKCVPSTMNIHILKINFRSNSNISPYNQSCEQPEKKLTSFEKYEKELINIQEFKEKYHDVFRKPSSVSIQNEVLNVTS